MTKARLSVNLQRRVRAQAHHRCGYCLRSEELTGERMTFEHIHPVSRGGLTVEENLWLACRSCNEHKGVKIHARPDLG